MRKLFSTLVLTSLVLSFQAQRGSAASGDSVPPRFATPSADKEEKPKAEKPAQSRSLLQRIFGPRPTPTPAPTPAPAVKHHPKPKPKPAAEETPEETPKKVTAKETPKEKAKETPKEAAKVSSTETVPAAAPTPKPKTGKGGKKAAAVASTDPAGLDDATKFKNAKAKAMEDAHVKELKSKADGETDDAAAHKALVNYNRALFQKIREVDPSVSDYAGRVEQALTKQISSEKGKE